MIAKHFKIVELANRLEKILLLGIVSAVDLANSKVRVEYATDDNGDPALTPWIKWGVQNASDNIEWNPPKVGEQVMLGCPSGNIALAKIITRFYQTNYPAPSSADNIKLMNFSDGAVISYDTAAKHLAVELPAGATLALNAAGGLTLTGDVTLNGKLTATGNIKSNAEIEDSAGRLSRLRGNYNTGQYIGNLGSLTSITNKVDN